MMNVHANVKDVLNNFQFFDKISIETFENEEPGEMYGTIYLTLGNIEVGGTIYSPEINDVTFYRRHTKEVTDMLTTFGIPFGYY